MEDPLITYTRNKFAKRKAAKIEQALRTGDERMRCAICGSPDPDVDDGRCMDCISAGIAARQTEAEWAATYYQEVVEPKDRLTRLAHAIVYKFASRQYGDLFQNENFVKAVRDIKENVLRREMSG